MPQSRSVADAGVDFVSGNPRGPDLQGSTDIAQLLAPIQNGIEFQPTEARTVARGTFQSLGITDAPAEHLEATADADQLAAVAKMAMQVVIPPLRTQPRQIGPDTLRAGQNDDIGRGRRAAGPDESQIDLWMSAERIKIGVIADPRQHRHQHPQ